MIRSFAARAKRSIIRKPTVEVHIPISPTPVFFNMVQCLALSLRAFGGICRDAPIILTVGDSTIDASIEKRYPWLSPLGVELRWVAEPFFREYSFHATGATRLWHDYRSDVVLLLDADILIARPFDEMIRDAFRKGHVAGVIGPASPLQFFCPPYSWHELYRHCGLDEAPDLRFEHPGWPYYFSSDEIYRKSPAYFNYGMICAPSSFIRRIGETYFSDLLKLRELTPNLLITQIALTTSMIRARLPQRALPVRYNFPNHPMLEALHGPELPMATFLHLKEKHQFKKFDLFDDLANVRETIQRTDLRGINELARRVLHTIEPDLLEPDQGSIAA